MAVSNDALKQNKSVKRFRGIQTLRSLLLTSMDFAVDCMGVIVSQIGDLERFLFPSLIGNRYTGPGPNITTGPQFLFDYQKANGTRLILAQDGNNFWYWNNTGTPPLTPSLINSNALNAGDWMGVTSNNIFFCVNGQRAMKYVGPGAGSPMPDFQPTGIPKPTTPTLGATLNITSIQRTANVVTVTFPVPFNRFIHLEVGDPVQIAGVSDATLNGQYPIVTSVVAGSEWSFTYNNTGANTALILGSGTINITATFTSYPLSAVQRDGVPNVNAITYISPLGWDKSPQKMMRIGNHTEVSGCSDARFDGLQYLAGVANSTFNWFLTYWLSNFTVAGTVATGTIRLYTNQFSPAAWGQVGYKIAYKNSVTGHVGPASDPLWINISNFAGNSYALMFNFIYPDTTTQGADRVVVFRTMRNGADFFKLEEINIFASPWSTFPPAVPFVDTYSDDELDTSVLAPLYNFPPPADATIIAKFQNRVFLAGMASAPQDIVYSGYEKVSIGRPEESFFPNNRLKLAIGADKIAGMGVIPQGVVAWSISNEMFMFRGAVEDIVIDLPVAFSAYLDQLPYQEGCCAKKSVQATPLGVVWKAADRHYKAFNGSGAPITLSMNLTKLLQRENAAMVPFAQSAYINYQGRDWYVASVALDGASYFTHMIFFDMEEKAELNVGAFPIALAHSSIGTVDYPDGSRHLIFGANGILYELSIAITSTVGIENGAFGTGAGGHDEFWLSGPYGADSPEVMKMFRRGQLTSTGRGTYSGVPESTYPASTDKNGFRVDYYLTDGKTYTPNNPKVVTGLPFVEDIFGVNWKGKWVQIRIQFPPLDYSASVINLDASFIPSSNR